MSFWGTTGPWSFDEADQKEYEHLYRNVYPLARDFFIEKYSVYGVL